MFVLRPLVALGAAALLLPGASPATGQAGFTWRQQLRVDGSQDVIGPRADGRLVIATNEGLYLFRRGGRPTPFARGQGGYVPVGGENCAALARGRRLSAAGCRFRRDDLYVLDPTTNPGVIKVDRNGRATRLVSFPGAVLSGITFDQVGRFGSRLLVAARISNQLTLYAVDCRGRAQVVLKYGPQVEAAWPSRRAASARSEAGSWRRTSSAAASTRSTYEETSPCSRARACRRRRQDSVLSVSGADLVRGYEGRRPAGRDRGRSADDQGPLPRAMHRDRGRPRTGRHARRGPPYGCRETLMPRRAHCPAFARGRRRSAPSACPSGSGTCAVALASVLQQPRHLRDPRRVQPEQRVRAHRDPDRPLRVRVLGPSYASSAGAEIGRLVVVLSPWPVATVGISVTVPLLFVHGRGWWLPIALQCPWRSRPGSSSSSC
jgi:hypothetical protein